LTTNDELPILFEYEDKAISTKLSQQEAFKQAFSYLKSGDARMCLTVCNVTLQRFPKDLNLLCLCARANIALRLFEDAKKRLDEAILIAPDFAIARGDKVSSVPKLRIAKDVMRKSGITLPGILGTILIWSSDEYWK